MGRLGIVLAFLALSLGSGCAFEAHSVGSGGALDGHGGASGAGGASTGGAGGDVGGGGAGGGAIVEQPACTPATERTACPGTSCDPATMRCSLFKLASRPACWTCVSDTDCEEPDHRCVAMYHEGDRFPDEKTGFCLQVAIVEYDGGVYEFDEVSDCAVPFMTPIVEGESLSGGLTQSYCGIREDLTTCYAVRAFANQEPCPDGTDEECPEGGICRAFGSGVNAGNWCTYECTANAECPSLDGYGICGGFCGG